jgi:SAM-dependent methyltransferase
MPASEQLRDVLKHDVPLRELERGIYSILPPDEQPQAYDGKGAIYDLVIARPIYNRLVWGADVRDYAAFARQALDASSEGWLADVGCGSLAFTHDVYTAGITRPVVLLDRSLDMLRRARQRLCRATGSVPENIVLVLGDAFALPFQDGAIATVACPGLLHLFEQPENLVRELVRVLAPGGGLYLTSLVLRPERRLSARWLAMLHRQGEVARPRTLDELLARLASAGVPGGVQGVARGNMAYLVSGNSRGSPLGDSPRVT